MNGSLAASAMSDPSRYSMSRSRDLRLILNGLTMPQEGWISLAENPEILPKAPGSPFSCARLVIYRDAPALRVFFTYDATQVRLICVEFAG
jgi:hypothetical protein